MEKTAFSEAHRDYQRIAKAIELLNGAPQKTLSLEGCANHLHLSKDHFQKMFTRWAGVSPKQYSQFLKKEYARECLDNSNTLADAAHDSFLSGTGRLHDLFIRSYGMTPDEYKRRGQSLDIHYGAHESPFGYCLIASTEKGICKLAFYDNEDQKRFLIEELNQEWGLANIKENQTYTAGLLPEIFESNNTRKNGLNQPLNILLKGSKFQLQVWEALLKIQPSEILSYQTVAAMIGEPDSTRAVSSAIARNNIAWLIPCHRVIRKNGCFNQYRWGPTRKQAMLAWEASQEHCRSE